MAANPVFKALVAARVSQVTQDERAIAEQVNEALGAPPADDHRPARFIKWCEDQNLPWRPATPAVIAKFVLEHTKVGKLLEEVRLLSQAHSSIGLPDPTAAWQVARALLRLIGTDAPRSWPNEQRAVFLALPPDLQEYLIVRERERDGAVRRAQHEAAELRKKYAQTPKVENETAVQNAVA
jgi:hypothetical protein